MRRRQALPHLWLMTDERADAMLETALHRLPPGAGVVFRHHSLPVATRRARFRAVAAIARRRRLVLLLAGSVRLARAWGADGVHGTVTSDLLSSAAAHTMREVTRAARADLLFVSPVFATRSHPGGRPLGRVRFARLAAAARQPVMALGGMDKHRGRHLAPLGAFGWAAIDAWSV